MSTNIFEFKTSISNSVLKTSIFNSVLKSSNNMLESKSSDSNFKPKTLVVIDKPYGITSMTVVRILRKILKPVKISKIGYAGTLDPCATGVLIVGIGRSGTKLLGEHTNKDKEYICEIDLLKNSESGDMQDFKQEYQMTLSDKILQPNLDTIINLINEKFIGPIKQIPPTLSAIKINGKKACDMARKGIKLEMKERTITIHKIDILSYNFPVLKLQVKCSKGTYIRTLGKDIGKSLGLWGTLLSLRRIKCGEYSIDDALDLNTLTIKNLDSNELPIIDKTI
jgi:tRNA pseudouridine55 synthase